VSFVCAIHASLKDISSNIEAVPALWHQTNLFIFTAVRLFSQRKTPKKHKTPLPKQYYVTTKKIRKIKQFMMKPLQNKQKSSNLSAFNFTKILQSAASFMSVKLNKIKLRCPYSVRSHNWGKYRLTAVYEHFYIQIQKQKNFYNHHTYGNLVPSFLHKLHRQESSKLFLYEANHQPFSSQHPLI